ncbi:MAG: hypothetical protein J7J65_03240 [Candidatus Korarchaeota archaeon]|nr:hypothetical protein [Candidatus Korarchaeota archaeon]
MKTILKTPSRIHFGILDMKGDLKRMYGSVGVALSDPRTIIEVSDANDFQVFGEERAPLYAKRVRNYFKIKRGMNIRVVESIPPHVGLGSGTQLSLGIGYAMLKHVGMEVSIERLAKVLGRGKRSGIGIYSFKHGGLIIDGGIKDDELPILISRYEFPEDWLFVIGIPNIEEGISGKEEDISLRDLTKKLREENRCTCETFRVLFLELIPSLMEKDIQGFGEAITRLEREVGRMFSYVQGGIFRSPLIEKGVEFLLENGAYGAGQSSWGPAFYGLTDKDSYQKLADRLRDFLRKHGGGEVIVSRANNIGAHVITI